jgi:hypothetical protein
MARSTWMLTAQFYDATGVRGFYNAGFGDLGAAGTVQGIQTRLAALGKIGSGDVTGIMNDNTMAALYKLAFADVVKLQKIAGLLSNDVATAIGYIVSILNGINSVLCCGITPDDLFKNWDAAIGVVSIASQDAADKLQAARVTLYNGIADRADQILKVMNVLNPAPTSPVRSKMVLDIRAMPGLLPVSSGTAPGTAPATPPGTIYAPSSKSPGMYRIAIPKTAGGLGGIGVMEDGAFGECIFGDCGLGAAATFTEIAPAATPPPGGLLTTESDLEAKTGQLPFYKKPLFWGIVAGSVVVIGGGSWLLLRRRKSAAAPAGKQVTRAR